MPRLRPARRDCPAFVAPRAHPAANHPQADTSARVVDAVEELNGVVTVTSPARRAADVSAERSLALAARLGEEATLDVREDGALTFKFPPKTARPAAVDGKERWLQRCRARSPRRWGGRPLGFVVRVARCRDALARRSPANEDEQRRDKVQQRLLGAVIWGPSPFDVFYYPILLRPAAVQGEMNFLEAVSRALATATECGRR